MWPRSRSASDAILMARSSLCISRVEKMTVRPLVATLRAMDTAKAVLPIEGRPAIYNRSPG